MSSPDLMDVLLMPRRHFRKKIEVAKARAIGSGLRNLLKKMEAAMDYRSPTDTERSLIEAITKHRGDPLGTPSKCLRCGGGAHGVASVLAGFACCETCWQAVSFLIEQSKERLLNVDLVAVDIGNMDLSLRGTASMDEVEFA